jgi:hypothetical protein
MTGCSVDVTVVTVVAAVGTGVPQPDGTTVIAATGDPRVRMKWEARRRVRHPEQISQSVFHKTIESSTDHPRSRHRHLRHHGHQPIRSETDKQKGGTQSDAIWAISTASVTTSRLVCRSDGGSVPALLGRTSVDGSQRCDPGCHDATPVSCRSRGATRYGSG